MRIHLVHTISLQTAQIECFAIPAFACSAEVLERKLWHMRGSVRSQAYSGRMREEGGLVVRLKRRAPLSLSTFCRCRSQRKRKQKTRAMTKILITCLILTNHGNSFARHSRNLNPSYLGIMTLIDGCRRGAHQTKTQLLNRTMRVHGINFYFILPVSSLL